LRGFLGLNRYYRKFINNYGSISKPLTDQLKKDAFNWGSEVEKTFEFLKRAMIIALILALSDFSQPFILGTDVCDKGIGL
jgi:RNase H-like domain found in reverse transcriptase